MVSIVTSKNDVRSRLADERWAHITEEHCELAGLRTEVLDTVAHPARILAGSAGELLAMREIEAGKPSPRRRHDVVFVTIPRGRVS